MIPTIGEDGRCECSCADRCPLKHVGMTDRCTREELEAAGACYYVLHEPPKSVQIKITCTYFKKSGKFYTRGSETFSLSLFGSCIYPKEFGKFLRDIRRLPGLQSGTWEGPFVCEPEDSYPELVLAEVDEA